MSDPADSSGSADQRRSTKPIMEKRRRARINASLAELKSLLLEVMRREGSRHSKMEKADILEMTVRHLRQIQKQHFAAAVANDPGILNKYVTGFNECASEVSRYMNTMEGLDPDLRAKLMNHLANCIQGVSDTTASPIAPTAHASNPGVSVAHVRPLQVQTSPSSTGSPGPVNIAPKPASVTEINNNSISNVQVALSSPPSAASSMLVGGVPVIPGKTPSGDIAFVIPGNVLTNGQLPSYVIPVYTGATVSAIQPQIDTKLKVCGPVLPPTQTAVVLPAKQEPVSPSTSSRTPNSSPDLAPSQQNHARQPGERESPPLPPVDQEDVWRPW